MAMIGARIWKEGKLYKIGRSTNSRCCCLKGVMFAILSEMLAGRLPRSGVMIYSVLFETTGYSVALPLKYSH